MKTTLSRVWIADADAAKALADALIDYGWVDELSTTREALPKWLMGQEEKE